MLNRFVDVVAPAAEREIVHAGYASGRVRDAVVKLQVPHRRASSAIAGRIDAGANLAPVCDDAKF